MKRWQFILHQQALEEIDGLRPAERRDVRAFSGIAQEVTADISIGATR